MGLGVYSQAFCDTLQARGAHHRLYSPCQNISTICGMVYVQKNVKPFKPNVVVLLWLVTYVLSVATIHFTICGLEQ